MKTKTKYVPVKFDTPQEFCKALFDGRKFRVAEGYIVYENHYDICWKHNCRPEKQFGGQTVVDTLEEIIEEEVRWEDDLLEYEHGILCWVSNDSPEGRMMCSAIIVCDGTGLYHNNACAWNYATPLTKEEALKMVYSGDCTND